MVSIDKELDESNLIVTKSGEYDSTPTKHSDVVKTIHTLIKDWSTARGSRETAWLEAWASYFTTENSEQWVRANVSGIIGDAQSAWRHRIHIGKGYEAVETVVAYFMSATFPNDDWFDLVPVLPLGEGYKEQVRVMKKYLSAKLEQSSFKRHWNNFLRQLCVTGTSVLALPWRFETTKELKRVVVREPSGKVVRDNTPHFREVEVERIIHNGLDVETLNMLDVFLDPNGKDPNHCSFVRRLEKKKGEVLRLIENGVYPLAKDSLKSVADIRSMRSALKTTELRTYEDFVRKERTPSTDNELIDLYEYWGDIYINGRQYSDVTVTMVGDVLLNVETNPFPNKPFIFGTYTDILDSPYGFGLLDSVLGQLHGQNVAYNQQLDIQEVVVNPMLLVAADGVLDPASFKSEPGAIIPVQDVANVQYLRRDTDLSVSYDRAAVHEQRINQVTGINGVLSSGSVRDAERVTRAEVLAARDAGGNRLTSVYNHIENCALKPLLNVSYRFLQRFIVEDDVIRVRNSAQPSVFDYIAVGIEELEKDMSVVPRGASHVADKEYALRQRLDFVEVLRGLPPELTQAMVDWEELLRDLATRLLEEDADRFIKALPPPQEEEQAPQGVEGEEVIQPSPSPEELLQQQAFEQGGAPRARAFQEAQQAGQLPEELQQLAGRLGV